MNGRLQKVESEIKPLELAEAEKVKAYADTVWNTVVKMKELVEDN